jgi:peroxiredoxin Q/BCP
MAAEAVDKNRAAGAEQSSRGSVESLEVGDKAPGFTLPADGGGEISLKDFAGKPVVLYFYPKDDTPGCTTEACAFRDSLPDFARVKAAVIGVSRDSVASHDKFKKKYKLPFPLVSDEDGKVCEAYGVWTEKNMYGKKYMGIERSSFLIDGKGVIRGVWRKVTVPGHVEEVLEAAKALK